MKTCWQIAPALMLSTLSALACDLKVESAWIRLAPGNATVLAGYAALSNGGGRPVTVVSAQSTAFARVEMHESLTENGIAKMRPINELNIAAGGKQLFEPGGKHFMLINPKAALRSGDVVIVKLKDSTGCETAVDFKVGGMAPADAVDHSKHH